MLLLYDNYWLVSLLLLSDDIDYILNYIVKDKVKKRQWHRKVDILVIAES